MTRRVYRYELPVDDAWHELLLTSPPHHVAARDPRTVELWALHDDDAPELVMSFRVVGTGQELPVPATRIVGTALAAGGSLVWHVVQRPTAGLNERIEA